MKLTKETLKRIIKEEIQNAYREPDSDEQNANQEPNSDEQSVETKNEFSKKFLELSKQVRGIKNLDAVEMQTIMSLTVSLIKLSAGKNAGTILKQIEAIADKKAGDPQ